MRFPFPLHRPGVGGLRRIVGAGGLLLSLAVAAGDDGARWVRLYTAMPPPPARADDAVAAIGVRADARGFVAVEVIDPTLRRLQQDVDALHAPLAAGSAAAFDRTQRALNNDPKMARLARDIDRVLQLDAPDSPPPTPAEVLALKREAEQVLAGRGAGGAAAPPASPILAYQAERQRTEPRARRFYERLFALQARYGALHAASDHDALAQLAAAGTAADAQVQHVRVAAALVARHRDLAQQQLMEAGALFAEARAALTPAVEHMAMLLDDAAARDASPAERAVASSFLKAHAELLLTIDRIAIEDAGFWSSVRAGPRGGARLPLYEFGPAPDIDLRVGVAVPVPGAPYPPGRARRSVPPGIH